MTQEIVCLLIDKRETYVSLFRFEQSTSHTRDVIEHVVARPRFFPQEEPAT
jgi:hypothetical protein